MVSTKAVSNTQIFRSSNATIIRLGHQADLVSIPGDGSIFSLDQAIGVLSDSRTIPQGNGVTLLDTKGPELTSSEPPLGKLCFLLNLNSDDIGENTSTPNLLQKTLRSFNLIDSYNFSRDVNTEPFEDANRERRTGQELDVQRRFILENLGNSPEKYFTFFRSRLRRICKEEIFFELLNREIHRALQPAKTDNSDEKITTIVNQLIRAKDGAQTSREHYELGDEHEYSRRLLFKDLLEEELTGTGEELLRNTTIYGHTISNGVLIRELRDKQFSTSTTKLLERSSQGAESREKVERAVKLLRDLAFYQDLVIRCKTLNGGEYNLLTQAIDTLTSSFDETGDIRITISGSDTPVERLIKQAQIETLKIYNAAFNQEAEALDSLLLEQPLTLATAPSPTPSHTQVSASQLHQPTILFEAEQPNNSAPVIDPIIVQAASSRQHSPNRRRVLAWGIGAGVLGSVLTVLGAAGYNQFSAWQLEKEKAAEVNARKKIEEEQQVAKKKAELTARIDAALNLDLDAIRKQAVDELEEVKKVNPIEGVYDENLGLSLMNRYTKVLVFYLATDPEDSTLKTEAKNVLQKLNTEQTNDLKPNQLVIFKKLLSDFTEDKISRDNFRTKLSEFDLVNITFIHPSFRSCVNLHTFKSHNFKHTQGIPKDLITEEITDEVRKLITHLEWGNNSTKYRALAYLLGEATLPINMNTSEVFCVLNTRLDTNKKLYNPSAASYYLSEQMHKNIIDTCITTSNKIELGKKAFIASYRGNNNYLELLKIKKSLLENLTFAELDKTERSIDKIAELLEKEKREVIAFDRCLLRLTEITTLIEKKSAWILQNQGK